MHATAVTGPGAPTTCDSTATGRSDTTGAWPGSTLGWRPTYHSRGYYGTPGKVEHPSDFSGSLLKLLMIIAALQHVLLLQCAAEGARPRSVMVAVVASRSAYEAGRYEHIFATCE